MTRMSNFLQKMIIQLATRIQIRMVSSGSLDTKKLLPCNCCPKPGIGLNAKCDDVLETEGYW